MRRHRDNASYLGIGLALLAFSLAVAACGGRAEPTSTSTPTRPPATTAPSATPVLGTPVVGWAGQIYSYPPFATYDDYFQTVADNRPYGLTGRTAEIERQIDNLRDSGRTVLLTGTLFNNVGDVENRRIVVDLVRVSAEEITATATATPSPTILPPTATPAPTNTPTAAPVPVLPSPTHTFPPLPPPTMPPAPTWTPFPTATPTPVVITDWKGEYFDNQGLVGPPVKVRNDVAVNFDWGDAGPVPQITGDRYSVRWTGSFYFPRGDYRFDAYADDGVRVYLDGFLLIDEWHDWRDQVYSNQFLNVGEGRHTVAVEYVNYGGLGRVWVRWSPVGNYPQWTGEYYNSLQPGSNRALVRNDAAIDFNWGLGSPGPSVQPDYFSARWTRTVTLQAGNYRFWVAADDGVRVWLNNIIVINEWHDGFKELSVPITGIASGYYQMQVEYYDRSNQATVKFWWEYTGLPSQPIPQ